MKNESISAIENRIQEISKELNIESILDKYPSEVSGGERQRGDDYNININRTRVTMLRFTILLCYDIDRNISENYKYSYTTVNVENSYVNKEIDDLLYKYKKLVM